MKLLATLFAAVTSAAACTIVYVPIAAGPTFQVKVTDRNRPVSNLPLQLISKDHTKTQTTNGNGVATFQNIPPGTYQLRPKPDLGLNTEAAITVTAHGPASVTIPLAWPSHPPLQVRSLTGTLHPPAIYQLELLDPKTGKQLQTTQTSPDGRFQLKTPPPGLYFLQLTQTGTIPIEIDPTSPYPDLDLALGESSCGFYFTARHTCTQPELNITTLTGQVLEPAGAPIGPASVTLSHKNGELAEQLFTDKQGRFTSPTPLEGHYQLTVIAPGFTPVRQAVHAIRNSQPTPLRVQLGIMGSCSQATLQ